MDVPVWEQYQQDVLDVGGAIPTLTTLAPMWAAVLGDDPKVDFLVKTVYVGLDVNFVAPGVTPLVSDYVPAEHAHKVIAEY